MKTPFETRGLESPISLLPKYWDIGPNVQPVQASTAFFPPSSCADFPSVDSLAPDFCKNKNPRRTESYWCYKENTNTEVTLVKENKRYKQELWGIFNPPCCLDFKFSLQHLILSEIDLSKRALRGDISGPSKWGMESASQTYFLWQELQASPPHYGSVPEEIPPRAPERTKATFPWAHPLLPPATAPKTSLKPPHKVTFSCRDTGNSPAGHVCVTASLSQRMTPLDCSLA